MTPRSLLARLRSFLDGIRHSSKVDADMKDEFTAHIELRAADIAKTGVPAAQALRQARAEFGVAAKHAEEGRESRGLRAFDQFRFSLLDFKLGFRMLLRYPGLTAVAGLALAFAICVGAAGFEFLNQAVNPTLPFENGERLVMLRNLDAGHNRYNYRSAYDLARWKQTIKTVENFGAFTAGTRNVVLGGEGTPLEHAEITANAFSIVPIAPLMGRALIAFDEFPDATPVMVIGFDVWEKLFNSDPAIVGRVVQFGRSATTIVGVMPEGYAFPIAQNAWTPLKLTVEDLVPGAGPSIRMFGMLAPDATLEDARVELANAGAQTAKDQPLTHENLRPQVIEYARQVYNIEGSDAAWVLSSNIFLIMLVVLVCANVALLMFARAATRESEMAVRAALGASRGRIVGQLFVEAVVLGVVASLVGLAVSRYAMQWGVDLVEAELTNNGTKLPFWIRGDLAPLTVIYVIGLTLLGAVIAGVLPALKVTRGLGARLKSATAGAGGLRFGGVWTAVIIAQVAVTVTFPAVSFFVRRDSQRIQNQPVGFASNQFLSARLDFDRTRAEIDPANDSLVAAQQTPAARHESLRQRLLADPTILGVTFASKLPRMYHAWNQVEADAGAAVAPRDTVRGHRVARVRIDASYFDVMGVPVTQGRAFNSSDSQAGSRVAIVNRTFVDSVFGGRNPLGHRIRFVDSESRTKLTAADSAWIEVVGVSADMGTVSGYGQAGVYEPMSAAGMSPVEVAIHTRVAPASYVSKVRALATLHDADLRLLQLQPLDNVVDAEVKFYEFWVKTTIMVSLVALLLSLAAIYSVMSFTVSRRTREIGIRVALGSNVRSITLVIFRRPVIQVGWGIALGGMLVTLFNMGTSGRLPTAQQMFATLAYIVVMTMVCALACIVPTRRALRVQPTEALRSDG